MKAITPGSFRRHVYMDDEAARRQVEAIARCDEVAEQHSTGALLTWLGVLAMSAASALVSVFAEVQP